MSSLSSVRDVLSRIPGPRHGSGTSTPFVVLDRSLCEACWCCMAACPEAVLGKVQFFRHKHAVIEAGERCTGCGKCVAACKSGALRDRVY
jgi:ferredoxin